MNLPSLTLKKAKPDTFYPSDADINGLERDDLEAYTEEFYFVSEKELAKYSSATLRTLLSEAREKEGLEEGASVPEQKFVHVRIPAKDQYVAKEDVEALNVIKGRSYLKITLPFCGTPTEFHIDTAFYRADARLLAYLAERIGARRVYNSMNMFLSHLASKYVILE